MRKSLIFALTLISTPAMATDATDVVKASARQYKVPVDFALKVADRESGIRCGVIGNSGERGPLQVLPKTANWMGFRNIRGASCRVQTNAGMEHLKRCLSAAGGDRWRAAACHNQGLSAISGRVTKRASRYANAVAGDYPKPAYWSKRNFGDMK